MGTIAAFFSSLLDTFATGVSFIALDSSLPENDMYYKIIAYSCAMGGNVLMLGSVSGLALMKMEHIHVGWFFKNVGWVVIVAWALGMLSLWLF